MWEKIRGFLCRNCVNFLILAVIAAVYAATMTPQVRAVFYQRENEPVYHGPDVPYASITCNVYQGGEYIEPMLQILKDYDARITWNLGGLFVRDNADLVRSIAAAGHELGNHGDMHLQHSTLSYEQNVSEIQACHEAVVQAVGIRMNIFAPPSGDYSDTTIQAARDLGYTSIMWSADTIDWRDQDVGLILSRVQEKMDDGGILLIHPTQATLEALPQILEILQEEKGLQIVPVGELLQMQEDQA